MNIQKKSMYIGLGIGVSGVVLMFICIFAGVEAPIIVPVLVWLGLIITMISSFLIGRKLKNTDGDKSGDIKKILIAFAFLIILTCLVTIIPLIK